MPCKVFYVRIFSSYFQHEGDLRGIPYRGSIYKLCAAKVSVTFPCSSSHETEANRFTSPRFEFEKPVLIQGTFQQDTSERRRRRRRSSVSEAMLDLQKNISLYHTAIPDCMDDGLEMGKAMEQISPPIGDMRYELARARTFQNCWPADGSGEKLASYGFYCIRDGERVRCAFCGLEISGLYVPAEDVKFRHWQFARNYCRFLKGEDVGNVTADTTSCVRNDNVLNKRRVDSVGGGSNPRIEQSRLLRATPVNLPPLAPLHGNHSSAFVNSSPGHHPS